MLYVLNYNQLYKNNNMENKRRKTKIILSGGLLVLVSRHAL